MKTSCYNNSPRFIKPSAANKVVHYWGDGSGRDNYIKYKKCINL